MTMGKCGSRDETSGEPWLLCMCEWWAPVNWLPWAAQDRKGSTQEGNWLWTGEIIHVLPLSGTANTFFTHFFVVTILLKISFEYICLRKTSFSEHMRNCFVIQLQYRDKHSSIDAPQHCSFWLWASFWAGLLYKHLWSYHRTTNTRVIQMFFFFLYLVYLWVLFPSSGCYTEIKVELH